MSTEEINTSLASKKKRKPVQIDEAADKRYWRAKQAAAYIPVCVQTLYDWVRQAEGKKSWYEKKVSRLVGPPVPYRKFGRNKILFPIEKFKAWVDRPQQQGQK